MSKTRYRKPSVEVVDGVPACLGIRWEGASSRRCGKPSVEVIDGVPACEDHLQEIRHRMELERKAKEQSVVVSRFGEKIRPFEPGKDEEEIASSNPMIHEDCDGWVDLMTISMTHRALCCRRCGMRVVIPKHAANSLADLDRYMAGQQEVWDNLGITEED